MVDEAVPVEVNGEKYHLRFDRRDGRAIEREHRPILMLLQPNQFGWDAAAIFLHKGLKKLTPEGKYVYALPQTSEGEDMAFEFCQKFTGQFKGAATGIALLYGMINKALILSGYYLDPEEKKEEKTGDSTVQAVDPAKNSQTYTQ